MKYSDLKEIRGSIATKIIKGREYCYLKFREGDKVITVYLGKPGSSRVAEAEEKLKQYRLEKKNTLRKPRLGHYIVQSIRYKNYWDDIRGTIGVTRTYADGYVAAFRSFDKKTPVRIITMNNKVIGEY